MTGPAPLPGTARLPGTAPLTDSAPRPLLGVGQRELARRSSVKWREYPADVIPLWVAEMDVLPPAPVVAALREAIETGDLGYAWGQPYCEAAIDYAAQQWQLTVERDQVRLVMSVVGALTEVIRSTPGHGEVVVSAPVYGPFAKAAHEAGRRLRVVGLGPDLRLDLDAIDDAFAAATSTGGGCLYLLCNPHNPTGVVPTRQELRRLADLAEHHGVTVVSDEIHSPLTMPGIRHTSFLSVAPESSAVVLFSASKAWNVSGAKAAVAFAGRAGVDGLRRLPVSLTHGASHLGVIAHTAALRHGQPWLSALRSDLMQVRDQLAELVRRRLPGVRMTLPDASFLAWLDCRELGLGDDPARHFLDRARVALSPGLEFVSGGEGFVRLNFATLPSMLDRAIGRMAASLP